MESDLFGGSLGKKTTPSKPSKPVKTASEQKKISTDSQQPPTAHSTKPKTASASAAKSMSLPVSVSSSSRKVSQEWLTTLQENNKTNDRNNAPSPQNNSNCYTRGPVELQTYKSCYTTGEKGTIEQTTATMALDHKQ